jgi:glycosyltransferase involved in cell wall biosynthesis
MSTLLLEGPFESDYSLAIVNRNLARALAGLGVAVRLHQRDNTTAWYPKDAFLESHPDLAPLFVKDAGAVSTDAHSRNIYPPYTDGFRGKLRAMHCYAWEETVFPREFVEYFNRGLDLVTVTSAYVREVLARNGVTVPIEVVGNGADHILAEPAQPVEGLGGNTFTFLHVSSCFPRKAVDVLVRAFCREFQGGEDVRLIVKTFPNPHNEIEPVLREIGREYPRHAPIEVISTPLDSGRMRYLYEHAGCLVSPSRGEGFGLPAAEAMLVGCPVIATIYSGQADICQAEHCWPVDYKLEPARTHLTQGESFWAEPVLDSLQRQMRNVYKAPARERSEKTERAQRFVQGRFTWKKVAERHWGYCQEALKAARQSAGPVAVSAAGERSIGFVTTWNTKCGIAEYTRYLATNLPAGHRFAIFANRPWEELVRPDEPGVMRCWEPYRGPWTSEADIEEPLATILKSGVSAVSIQYNFSFFTPASLKELLKKLRRKRIVTTVTMHAIKHKSFPQVMEALKEADFCICHRQADVDVLQQAGVKNVLLRKQGIVSSQLDAKDSLSRAARTPLHFVVSCFGFFLPPKGIYQLIQAFALAKSVQPMLRLKLLNSLYPVEASVEYARQCMRLIGEKNLRGDVHVSTAFLDHEETLRELGDSDLVVLPYLYSTESSSAAGAFAIASLRPVLCSDLPLFDELADVIHRFPSGNVIALANKILQLAEDPIELNRYRTSQEALVRRLAWPAIASDFAALVGERIDSYGAGPRGLSATTAL